MQYPMTTKTDLSNEPQAWLSTVNVLRQQIESIEFKWKNKCETVTVRCFGMKVIYLHDDASDRKLVT